MKKLSYKLVIIFSTLWLLYFIYSIVLTIYDISTVKQINWNQAKNISKSYGGYKATIITRSYTKDNINIAREYGYFSQGLNVWLCGIDKKAKYVDISFFIKKKDYQKIKNNQIPYKSDFFGNTYPQKEPIPFFGLRNVNKTPNEALLFLDLWKYNYSKGLSIVIFFFPYILAFLIKKIKKLKIEYNDLTDLYNMKITGIFFIIFIFIFII